jgi:cytochrome c biogenesis protein
MIALLRNTWRGLTSMRTALVLLFLLALAAMPGALLPQRSLNAVKVDQYIADHGGWGKLLDRLQAFDVYSSVWFSAIYLLLFVSLVGCLIPRTLDYARSLRAKPVATPRNLSRLPHFTESTVDAPADEVLARAKRRLRGWRTTEHLAGESRSISAERGYLRETGNLVFHFAMLGLVVALALGKMFNYEGQVIVLADGSEFCNAGTFGYDTFRPGLRVDGTDLNPFCVKVNDFTAEYLNTGQAESFAADVEYQSGGDLDSNTWRPYQLKVNSPLRTAGDRVYLSGHGYAPTFTVTFPDGQRRTGTIQWRPVNQMTFLSEGATKFDRPGVTDPAQRRQSQLAVTGLFAPSAVFQGTLLDSGFPDLLSPAVAIDVLRGDLGLDAGRGQSIFEVDRSMVDDGRLKRVARANLKPGQEIGLDDGTKIRFDKVEQWVSLQISHDPTQGWVLAFSLMLIAGLATSLIIKRRRLWIRVTPAEDRSRTVIEVGGLARTDRAGYGEQFDKLAAELVRQSGRET